MYAVVITDEGGVQRRLDFSKPELTVGRVNGNDIVLAKRNVSKQHARLSLEDEKAVVVDLNSTNGTWVNGRKITAPHPLKSGDKIYIADFIITLESADENGAGPSQLSEPPKTPPKSSAARSSRGARSAMPGRSSMPLEASMPVHPRARRPEEGQNTSLPPRIESRPTDEAALRKPSTDPLTELLARLSDHIDVSDTRPESMHDQERWSAARAAIAETFLAMQKDGSVGAKIDMRQIAHTALHEAIGLGALDDLLSNESVEMVVVHGPDRILLDTGAGLRPTKLSFSSPGALTVVAKRLAAQSGQVLEDRAVVHGQLAFGPKVTILQAPLVANGPFIEIRVGRESSLEALVEREVMSADAATYVTKALAECRNVLVVGPQGAGVATLLSALVRELPEEEHTIVVEAVPDLDLDRRKVVALTALDAGLTLSDAIVQGTRLYSDHVVVHGIEGPELTRALSAIGTLDPGHLLGVRGVSSKDAIEGLLLGASSGGVDRASVAQLIGTTIDVVVALERSQKGDRVLAIHEVKGHEGGDVSYESVPM